MRGLVAALQADLDETVERFHAWVWERLAFIIGAVILGLSVVAVAAEVGSVVVLVTRWERGRSAARWDLVTWLLIVLGALVILMLATMWLQPIFFPRGCEPLFPDLQLPTLGVEP